MREDLVVLKWIRRREGKKIDEQMETLDWKENLRQNNRSQNKGKMLDADEASRAIEAENN